MEVITNYNTHTYHFLKQPNDVSIIDWFKIYIEKILMDLNEMDLNEMDLNEMDLNEIEKDTNFKQRRFYINKLKLISDIFDILHFYRDRIEKSFEAEDPIKDSISEYIVSSLRKLLDLDTLIHQYRYTEELKNNIEKCFKDITTSPIFKIVLNKFQNREYSQLTRTKR